MTINRKLFLNSLTIILIALTLIGIVIVNMLSIQTSNSDVMPKIIAIEEVNMGYTQVENTLTNYANAIGVAQPQSITDAAYETVDNYLINIQQNIEIISGGLSSDLEVASFTAFLDKHDILQAEVLAAIQTKDANAARTQAIRILGALNDVYMLELYAGVEYEVIQQQLSNKISNVILVATVGVVLLLIIGVTFTILITRTITKPLRALSERAELIANGEINVAPLNYKAQDEIGILNHSFTKMAEQLKSLLTSIHTASGQIDHFTTNLIDENQQLKVISEQVTHATDDLSEGTQHIATSVGNTVDLVERMDKDFTNNVERSSRSVQRSEDAAKAIEQSQKAIQLQQSLIEENIQTTTKINQVSEQFLEHTTQIEKMAQVVSDIADQTNLLALNASIEAARAGEHGKGFAVVADEVRKLAEQSNHSTKEIFDIVSAIKLGINEMSVSVQSGVQIAGKQKDSMGQTTDAFKLIETEVTRIMDEIAHVASDMKHSQNLGTQVLDEIASISAVVEEAAQNSMEISSSTSNQLLAIANVVEKIEALQNLTTELNATVGKFKM